MSDPISPMSDTTLFGVKITEPQPLIKRTPDRKINYTKKNVKIVEHKREQNGTKKKMFLYNNIIDNQRIKRAKSVTRSTTPITLLKPRRRGSAYTQTKNRNFTNSIKPSYNYRNRTNSLKSTQPRKHIMGNISRFDTEHGGP
eukprot:UN05676